MFKIRDFSRLTRVSVKMLRHYDELGLLPPARVDPASGYRYYSADQLPRLNRLIALKDLGFSLEQIANLLDRDLAVAELRGMLRLRQSEIAARIAAEQAQLARVEAHLAQLEHEAAQPTYDIVLRSVAPRLVAGLRRTITNEGQSIANLFDRLEAYVAAQRARAADSPLLIAHDVEYDDSSADVEVVVPLSRSIPAAPPIEVYELAGCPAMACVVYTGSYAQQGEALAALVRWVEANGYLVAGPLREVYLRFSADNAAELRLPPAFLARETNEFVTEIQVPVSR
jgi:DNA-binding transcriptional MerR regulator